MTLNDLAGKARLNIGSPKRGSASGSGGIKMANPKYKTPRSKTRKRRSHLHLILPNVVECNNCHAPKMQHCVCKNCGMYNGRQVLQARVAEEE